MAVDLQAFTEDVALVRERAGDGVDVALVLGSGLDGVVDALADRVEVSYAELRGLVPPTAVAGHSGALAIGTAGTTRVACFRGRLHCYQGVSAYEAAYTARLAAALGAQTFIVTNAAGSVVPDLPAGALMMLTDHLNLMGDNPLAGWPGPAEGTPFVPMGEAYSARLRSLARMCAAELGVELREGVYAGVLGPSYETPAEVRYLRTIGADAVGMSTVPEVIAARALEMEVLGISLITNAAGGVELAHDEVLEMGRRASADMVALLTAVLERV